MFAGMEKLDCLEKAEWPAEWAGFPTWDWRQEKMQMKYG